MKGKKLSYIVVFFSILIVYIGVNYSSDNSSLYDSSLNIINNTSNITYNTSIVTYNATNIFINDSNSNITFDDSSLNITNNTSNVIYNTSNDTNITFNSQINTSNNTENSIYNSSLSSSLSDNGSFESSYIINESQNQNTSFLLNNTILNESILSNSTVQNVLNNVTDNISENDNTIIDVKQETAQVGNSVTWKQKIYLKGSGQNIKVAIPRNAFNVSITTNNTFVEEVMSNGQTMNLSDFDAEQQLSDYQNTLSKINFYLQEKRNLKVKGIKQTDSVEKERLNERVDIENKIKLLNNTIVNRKKQKQINNIVSGNFLISNDGILSKLFKFIFGVSITGNAIYQDDSQIIDNNTDLVLNTTYDVIELEYQTEAPFVSEYDLSQNEKEITISSDYHYQNIYSYVDLDKEISDPSVLKLYSESADGSRTLFNGAKFVDTNGNGLIDRVEWITPHLSNESFILSINILNVQSYPYFHGNWTVYFTTYGKQDLQITAANGTVYGKDILPEQLSCAGNNISYNYIADVITVSNYSCEGTSTFTVYELSKGAHTQQFVFGDDVSYAYNDASGLIRFVSKPYLPKITPTDIQISSPTATYVTLNYTAIGTGGSGIITCTDANFDGIWDCPFNDVVTSNYTLTANGAGDSVSMNISFIDVSMNLIVSNVGGHIVVNGALSSAVSVSNRPVSVYENGAALEYAYNNILFNQRYFNLTVDNLTSTKTLFIEYVDNNGNKIRQSPIILDNTRIYGNYYYDYYEAENNINSLEMNNVNTGVTSTGGGLSCIGTCVLYYNSNPYLGYLTLNSYTGNNKIVTKYVYESPTDFISVPNPFKLTIRNSTNNNIDMKSLDMNPGSSFSYWSASFVNSFSSIKYSVTTASDDSSRGVYIDNFIVTNDPSSYTPAVCIGSPRYFFINISGNNVVQYGNSSSTTLATLTGFSNLYDAYVAEQYTDNSGNFSYDFGNLGGGSYNLTVVGYVYGVQVNKTIQIINGKYIGVTILDSFGQSDMIVNKNEPINITVRPIVLGQNVDRVDVILNGMTYSINGGAGNGIYSNGNFIFNSINAPSSEGSYQINISVYNTSDMLLDTSSYILNVKSVNLNLNVPAEPVKNGVMTLSGSANYNDGSPASGSFVVGVSNGVIMNYTTFASSANNVNIYYSLNGGAWTLLPTDTSTLLDGTYQFRAEFVSANGYYPATSGTSPYLDSLIIKRNDGTNVTLKFDLTNTNYITSDVDFYKGYARALVYNGTANVSVVLNDSSDFIYNTSTINYANGQYFLNPGVSSDYIETPEIDVSSAKQFLTLTPLHNITGDNNLYVVWNNTRQIFRGFGGKSLFFLKSGIYINMLDGNPVYFDGNSFSNMQTNGNYNLLIMASYKGRLYLTMNNTYNEAVYPYYYTYDGNVFSNFFNFSNYTNTSAGYDITQIDSASVVNNNLYFIGEQFNYSNGLGNDIGPKMVYVYNNSGLPVIYSASPEGYDGSYNNPTVYYLNVGYNPISNMMFCNGSLMYGGLSVRRENTITHIFGDVSVYADAVPTGVGCYNNNFYSSWYYSPYGTESGIAPGTVPPYYIFIYNFSNATNPNTYPELRNIENGMMAFYEPEKGIVSFNGTNFYVFKSLPTSSLVWNATGTGVVDYNNYIYYVLSYQNASSNYQSYLQRTTRPTIQYQYSIDGGSTWKNLSVIYMNNTYSYDISSFGQAKTLKLRAVLMSDLNVSPEFSGFILKYTAQNLLQKKISVYDNSYLAYNISEITVDNTGSYLSYPWDGFQNITFGPFSSPNRNIMFTTLSYDRTINNGSINFYASNDGVNYARVGSDLSLGGFNSLDTIYVIAELSNDSVLRSITINYAISSYPYLESGNISLTNISSINAVTYNTNGGFIYDVGTGIVSNGNINLNFTSLDGIIGYVNTTYSTTDDLYVPQMYDSYYFPTNPYSDDLVYIYADFSDDSKVDTVMFQILINGTVWQTYDTKQFGTNYAKYSYVLKAWDYEPDENVYYRFIVNDSATVPQNNILTTLNYSIFIKSTYDLYANVTKSVYVPGDNIKVIGNFTNSGNLVTGDLIDYTFTTPNTMFLYDSQESYSDYYDNNYNYLSDNYVGSFSGGSHDGNVRSSNDGLLLTGNGTYTSSAKLLNKSGTNLEYANWNEYGNNVSVWVRFGNNTNNSIVTYYNLNAKYYTLSDGEIPKNLSSSLSSLQVINLSSYSSSFIGSSNLHLFSRNGKTADSFVTGSSNGIFGYSLNGTILWNYSSLSYYSNANVYSFSYNMSPIKNYIFYVRIGQDYASYNYGVLNSTGSVMWEKNVNDTYASYNGYYPYNYIHQLISDDFNNDGKPEFFLGLDMIDMFVDSNGNILSEMPNEGGYFIGKSSAMSYDYDKDGYKDVVEVSWYGGPMFIQTCSLNLKSCSVITYDEYSGSSELADLGNENKGIFFVDLSVHVNFYDYLHNTYYGGPLVQGYIVSTSMIDYEGDGVEDDIVFSSTESNNVYIYKYNGTLLATIPTSSPGSNVYTIDFNNDKKKDIVIFSSDMSSYAIYDNKGNQITPVYAGFKSWSVEYKQGVQAVDVDGDGYPELVLLVNDYYGTGWDKLLVVHRPVDASITTSNKLDIGTDGSVYNITVNTHGQGVYSNGINQINTYVLDFNNYNNVVRLASNNQSYYGIITSEMLNGVSDGLVVRWKLNGNANDDLGLNNGTAFNTTNSTDRFGNPNGALAFNGVSSGIISTNSTMFTFSNGTHDLPFSVCAWIYQTSLTSGNIVAKDGGAPGTREWSFSSTSGKIALYIFAQGTFSYYDQVNANNSYSANNWHFVCSTYDGSQSATGINLYLDGFQQPTTVVYTSTLNMIHTNQNLTIGRFSGAINISDVQIYSSALSANEIMQEYNDNLISYNSYNSSSDFGNVNNYGTYYNNLTNSSSYTPKRYIQLVHETNVNNWTNDTGIDSVQIYGTRSDITDGTGWIQLVNGQDLSTYQNYKYVQYMVTLNNNSNVSDLRIFYNKTNPNQQNLTIFTSDVIDLSKNMNVQNAIITVQNQTDAEIQFRFSQGADTVAKFSNKTDYNNGTFGHVGFTPAGKMVLAGTGTVWKEHRIENNYPYPAGLEITDINKNGYPDIITTGEYLLTDFKNLGNGSFLRSDIFNVSNRDGDWPTVGQNFGDFYNDGLTDILVGNYGDIYENLDNGSFVQRQSIKGGGAVSSSEISADMNNDGLLDAVFVNWWYQAYWEENIGNGLFKYHPISNYKGYAYSKIDDVVDINNDGYLDFYTNYDYWYKNLKNGSFIEEQFMCGNSVCPGSPVDALDINNDGYVDFYDYYGQYWYENLHNETFLQHSLNISGGNFLTPNYNAQNKNIDIDGDGKKDSLFSHSDGSINVTGWYGFLDDYTLVRHDVASLPGAGVIDAADLNGDGKIDFAAFPDILNGYISRFENVDNFLSGNWTSQPIYYNDSSSAEITWYENKPVGTTTGMYIRTGSTTNMSFGWSDWVPITRDDYFSVNNTYLEYQVRLFSNSNTSSPQVWNITLSKQDNNYAWSDWSNYSSVSQNDDLYYNSTGSVSTNGDLTIYNSGNAVSAVLAMQNVSGYYDARKEYMATPRGMRLALNSTIGNYFTDSPILETPNINFGANVNITNINILADADSTLSSFSSLTTWWKFDGDMKDYKGSENASVGYGNPIQTTGIVGGAYYFNGASYIQDIASYNYFKTGMTVSTWFKMDPGVTSGCFIAGAYTGNYLFQMGFMSDNHIRFRYYEAIEGFHDIYGQAVNDSVWNLATFTYDGSVFNLYLNGVYQGNIPVDSSLIHFMYFLDEGTSMGGGGNNWGTFNGSVDDVMIFNTVLNDYQIQQLYQNQMHNYQTRYQYSTNNGASWNGAWFDKGHLIDAIKNNIISQIKFRINMTSDGYGIGYLNQIKVEGTKTDLQLNQNQGTIQFSIQPLMSYATELSSPFQSEHTYFYAQNNTQYIELQKTWKNTLKATVFDSEGRLTTIETPSLNIESQTSIALIYNQNFTQGEDTLAIYVNGAKDASTNNGFRINTILSGRFGQSSGALLSNLEISNNVKNWYELNSNVGQNITNDININQHARFIQYRIREKAPTKVMSVSFKTDYSSYSDGLLNETFLLSPNFPLGDYALEVKGTTDTGLNTGNMSAKQKFSFSYKKPIYFTLNQPTQYIFVGGVNSVPIQLVPYNNQETSINTMSDIALIPAKRYSVTILPSFNFNESLIQINVGTNVTYQDQASGTNTLSSELFSLSFSQGQYYSYFFDTVGYYTVQFAGRSMNVNVTSPIKYGCSMTNCIIDTTSMPTGQYHLYINLTKENYIDNYTVIPNKIYVQAEYADIILDIPDVIINNVSQYNFMKNITVVNNADRIVTNATVGFVGAPPQIGLTVSPNSQICYNISIGGSCIKEFMFNISPPVPEDAPDVHTITFDASFSPSLSGYKTKQFTINILQKPQITLNTSKMIFVVNQSSSTNQYFILNSTGNYKLKNISITTTCPGGAQNISCNIIPSYLSELDVGSSQKVQSNVAVPALYSAGNYSYQIKINTSQNVSSTLSLNITVNKYYASIFTPSTQSIIKDLSFSGQLMILNLTNYGNIPENFTVSITGDIGTPFGDGRNPKNGNYYYVGQSQTISIPIYALALFTSGIFNYTLNMTDKDGYSVSALIQLEIRNSPPIIYIDHYSSDEAELNEPFTIYVYAWDDQGMPVLGNPVYCNITREGSPTITQINATPNAGFYECTFVPQYSVNHYVTVAAIDKSNQTSISTGSFSVVSTTTATAAPTTAYISGVTSVSNGSGIFILTIANVGYSKAINVSLDVLGLSNGWNFHYNSGNKDVPKQTISTQIYNFTVPSGVLAITTSKFLRLNWTNQDGSKQSILLPNQLNIQIMEQPEILIEQFPSYDTLNVSTNKTYQVTVQNIGNAPLDYVSLMTNQSNNLSIIFTPTYVNTLPVMDNETFSMTVIVPVGTLYETPYPILVDVEAGGSVLNSFYYNLTVPALKYFYVNNNITITSPINYSGIYYLTLSNSGNVLINFNPLLYLSGVTAPGFLSLPVGQTKTLSLSYTGDSIPQERTGSLILDTKNLSITLKTVDANMNVYNISKSSVNLLKDDVLDLDLNFSIGSSIITENLTFAVKVGESLCTSLVFSLISNHYHLICRLPTMVDLFNYSLNVYATYSNGQDTLFTLIDNTRSIYYDDITPPNSVGLTNLLMPTPTSSIPINITVYDNSGVVSGVNMTVTLLNGSKLNYQMVQTNIWKKSIPLSDISNFQQNGNYPITFTMTDGSGLSSETTIILGIYDIKSFFGKLRYSNGSYINAYINITGLIDGTSYVSNTSGQSGRYEFNNIYTEPYKLSVETDDHLMLVLNDVDFSKLPSDFIKIDKKSRNIFELMGVVDSSYGYIISIPTQSTGFITLSYNGFDVIEPYLEIYSCLYWDNSTQSCLSNWWVQVPNSLDENDQLITGSIVQFSTSNQSAFVLVQKQPSIYPEMDIPNSLLEITQNPGITQQHYITIDSSGLEPLSNVKLSCDSGYFCDLFGISSDLIATIPASTQGVELPFNVTVDAGADADVYTGKIRIDSNVGSEYVNVQLTVPSITSYRSDNTPNFVSQAVGAGRDNILATLQLENIGNMVVPIHFKTTDDFFTFDKDLILPIRYRDPFRYFYYDLTYRAPQDINLFGHEGNITFGNYVINYQIITDSKVNITGISKTSDIVSGDVLTIDASAYNSTQKSSDVNWSVNIDGYNCPVIQQLPQIQCIAPSLLIGKDKYELLLEGDFGNKFRAYAYSNIEYRDVFAPTIVSFNNSVEYNDSGTILEFACDDYTGVLSVSGMIIDPNNNTFPLFIVNNEVAFNASTNVLYQINSTNYKIKFNDDAYGDYVARLTLTDVLSNIQTVDEPFEVYQNYDFAGRVVTPKYKNGLKTTFSFYSPDSYSVSQNKFSSFYDAVLPRFVSSSTTDGYYNTSLFERDYDVVIDVNNVHIVLDNADVTNITNNFDAEFENVSNIFLGQNTLAYQTLYVQSSLKYSGEIVFDIDPSQYQLNTLFIFRCENFSFNNSYCIENWQRINDSNYQNGEIKASIHSFSAYTLGKYEIPGAGGSGLSNTNNYYSTTSTTSSSGSSGGASINEIGSLLNSTISKINNTPIIKINQSNLINTKFSADVTEIDRDLYVGEVSNNKINVQNTQNETLDLDVTASDSIKDLLDIHTPTLMISSGEVGVVDFDIKVPLNYSMGLYTGHIDLKSKTSNDVTNIPVQIRVSESSSMQPSVRLKLAKDSFIPGENFKMTVFFTNIVDINLNMNLVSQIKEITTDKIILQTENSILNNMSSIDVVIPTTSNVSLGQYVVMTTLTYRELSGKVNDFSDSQAFSFVEPFLTRTYFLMPNWMYLILIAIVVILVFSIKEGISFIESKKRFHLAVDRSQLAQPGERAGYIGYLAETNERTFYEIDKLTTHALIAGSTGGGKSVAAQVFVEECLSKGVSVIVFDPTAQWTGFLRKSTDKTMLGLYSKYGMTLKEAHGYNGNVYQVNNSRQLIKIKEIMKPGEITVFALNKMDLKEIDTFVANTVRQVFKDNFDECKELRLLLVYDEVHRLLPKFGGNGIGFMQIERACREFRKWGIGLMLISQILSDFAGQIKANINTEVQLRTREETDLERLKTKYGEELLHAVVKAQVGTGMIQNSAYNRGRPYMVSFRPLLHSTERLSDDELTKYNIYNDKIADLFYELDQLEQLGSDVFDVRIELNLAAEKVKTGAFNLVDIYLETLTPRIKSLWDSVGKTPLKRDVSLVSQVEIEEDIRLAKMANQKAQSAQVVISGLDVSQQVPQPTLQISNSNSQKSDAKKEESKEKELKFGAVITDSSDSDVLYRNIESVISSLENEGKNVSVQKLKLTSLKVMSDQKEKLLKLKKLKEELEH